MQRTKIYVKMYVCRYFYLYIRCYCRRNGEKKIMINFFEELLKNIVRLITSIQWYDIIDIGLIAVVVYYSIKLLRRSRSFQLVKGLLLVGVVYAIVSALHMSTSTFVFNQLFNDIVIVIVLLFQPEIRSAVENLGRGKFKNLPFFSSRNSKSDTEQVCNAIAKAMYNMSDTNTGALVVLEGQTPLGEITKTGSEIDSTVTTTLLENIFFPKAPLHDGAVVISENRIHSAGCILPLSSAPISKQLGTRHRAALGMSEQSDALVIIVSEESGSISVCQSGTLERNITRGELLEHLISFLEPGQRADTKKLQNSAEERQ